MTTQIIITVLLIGLSAGILSGLVGVGGGIVMVPALVFFLHYTQHQAQGTSLAVITLPVVIVASLYYYHQCQKIGTPIDLRVVGLLAITFVVGGYFGSKLALSIDQNMLKKIFGVILFYTAIKMMGWDKVFMKFLRSL
ncbi:MAG: sulfite exporter TauE/SafE family protein [Chitinophagaceae bacterium]|nr:sulfite exporter TauE/SafE family protein [Chitinophagaceae bacterium]MBK8952590.1 sulfite exporter TauE/SafE family protein [Chitinophagaceae bacterium]